MERQVLRLSLQGCDELQDLCEWDTLGELKELAVFTIEGAATLLQHFFPSLGTRYIKGENAFV